jgi:glycosyltransferase involved in cell wall biosynthesis
MMRAEDLNEVLLITWHGIHELDIFPGLPDTGGQNIYVENMAQMIHDLYGARVIILNRGGFCHPYTERMREGMVKDPDRELYVLHVADDVPAFVRKEYLTGALIENAAANVLDHLPKGYRPELIISHFWDGGVMGMKLNQKFGSVPHVWIPHEPVGMKKQPLRESEYETHAVYTRERYEPMVVKVADAVGSTSKLVRDDLVRSYGKTQEGRIIDIFPGVDTKRFSPMTEKRLDGGQARMHAEYLNLPEEVFHQPHICEFGRSDSLKEKDKAVEAFARVAREIDDLVMFMNLDERMEPKMARRVRQIIESEKLEDRLFILAPKDLPQTGTGSEILPDLLKTSKLFLTMSIMEGFGMAACEAAACGIPVVGTDQIPVVTDVIEPAQGGCSVPASDAAAAADAVLDILKLNDSDYQAMCRRSYDAVMPKYRWDTIVKDMFNDLGMGDTK